MAIASSTYSIQVYKNAEVLLRKGFLRKTVLVSAGRYNIPKQLSHEIATELLKSNKAEKIVRGKQIPETKQA